jgi:hypothetical protein
VRVAVWENRRLCGEGKAFSSYKVIIERTYKDERAGFKSTASLGVDDIPKAILALTQAYSFLLGQRAQKENEESESLSLGLGSEWAP